MQNDLKFVWRAGDAWRDLTADLHEPVTIVSWNGTTHLLDATAGIQRRVALAGGHSMLDDAADRPLDRVAFASPCGVRLEGGGRWNITSRLVVVLAGHHPDWAASADGQAFLGKHAEDPRAPGHPDRACPVHLCRIAPAATRR